jgi:peptidoglycan/xylan/chitin deacetylase (PgdA/CDA1 family)
MPAAQPNGSGNWQQYSDTFSVPLDAVSVSVFMYANQNGWIQTDDYSITEYKPTGFNRPLLSMTFDDGHEDNVTTALPLLNQYGFKSTQCYATTFIEGNAQAVSDILKFKNSGHEICSHTVTHPFMTTLDPVTLNYELQHSKQYLESIIGQPVLNFASPYGDYNATVNNAIKTYYQSHRTVDEGYNSKDNFDPYRLRVQNVLDTTSANQVKIWIEQAKADNTWLILVYHRIASDPGPYDTYTNIFAEHLTAIQSSGIAVKTYQDAFTEVTGQL